MFVDKSDGTLKSFFQPNDASTFITRAVYLEDGTIYNIVSNGHGVFLLKLSDYQAIITY